MKKNKAAKALKNLERLAKLNPVEIQGTVTATPSPEYDYSVKRRYMHRHELWNSLVTMAILGKLK